MYVCNQADAAAFLMCRGFQIELVKVSSSRHEFRFHDSRAADEVTEFHRGATVVAKQYAAEMKSLKSLMHSSSNTQPTSPNEDPRRDHARRQPR